MFKNISNFLFNQFGGLNVDAPKKSVKELNVAELQEYVDNVCVSLAKQIIKSEKSWAESNKNLTDLLNQLVINLAGNDNFSTAMATAKGDAKDLPSLVSAIVDHTRKHYLEQKANAPARSSGLRSPYGGIVVPVGRTAGIYFSPFEQAVKSHVQTVVDTAPSRTVVVAPKKVNYDSIPMRSARTAFEQ